MTYASATTGVSNTTVHHSSIVSTMSEVDIVNKFLIYEDELTTLKELVANLVKQSEATTELIRSNTEVTNQQYQDTTVAMQTLQRTTDEKIKSSNLQLRKCIDRNSRRESKNTNTTQAMIQLLLQDRNIQFEEQDDLEDIDDESYVPNPMEDPEYQQNSSQDAIDALDEVMTTAINLIPWTIQKTSMIQLMKNILAKKNYPNTMIHFRM